MSKIGSRWQGQMGLNSSLTDPLNMRRRTRSGSKSSPPPGQTSRCTLRLMPPVLGLFGSDGLRGSGVNGSLMLLARPLATAASQSFLRLSDLAAVKARQQPDSVAKEASGGANREDCGGLTSLHYLVSTVPGTCTVTLCVPVVDELIYLVTRANTNNNQLTKCPTSSHSHLTLLHLPGTGTTHVGTVINNSARTARARHVGSTAYFVPDPEHGTGVGLEGHSLGVGRDCEPIISNHHITVYMR